MNSILITGGTGFLGRALVDKLINQDDVDRIVIYSRDEHKQEQILKKYYGNEKLRLFIGDVRDSDRLNRAMENIDYVIHTAALKIVPSCEYNPIEAIKTNIDGTVNVVETCINNSVKKAIFISTDKAVESSTLYGSTKSCAEKLFISANSFSGSSKCKFIAVRYGNVFNSTGSVLQLFKDQIKKDNKVTLTDLDMTRFIITIKDAVNLCLHALKRGNGGEIFVPKIKSLKVVDLIDVLRKEDTQKEIIGKRTGEKLHEILISSNESDRVRYGSDMFIILPDVYRSFIYKGFAKKLDHISLQNGAYTSNNNIFYTKKELMELINDTL